MWPLYPASGDLVKLAVLGCEMHLFLENSKRILSLWFKISVGTSTAPSASDFMVKISMDIFGELHGHNHEA